MSESDYYKELGQQNAKDEELRTLMYQGVYFPRYTFLICASIACIIVSFILDDLANAGKDSYFGSDPTKTCVFSANCGWREATYKWQDNGFTRNPNNCVTGTYTINYSDACEKVEDACSAYNAGNTFLAFEIIALIALLIHFYVTFSVCMKKPQILPNKCQKNVKSIMTIMSAIAGICCLVGFIVWLGFNACDSADPRYFQVFVQGTSDSPGISEIFLLLGGIIQFVLCGAVMKCWPEKRNEETKQMEKY